MSDAECINKDCDHCDVVEGLKKTLRRQKKRISRLEQDNQRAWSQVHTLGTRLNKVVKKKR